MVHEIVVIGLSRYGSSSIVSVRFAPSHCASLDGSASGNAAGFLPGLFQHWIIGMVFLGQLSTPGAVHLMLFLHHQHQYN